MTNIDKEEEACSSLDGILNKPEALENTFEKENLKLALDFNNV